MAAAWNQAWSEPAGHEVVLPDELIPIVHALNASALPTSALLVEVTESALVEPMPPDAMTAALKPQLTSSTTSRL